MLTLRLVKKYLTTEHTVHINGTKFTITMINDYVKILGARIIKSSDRYIPLLRANWVSFYKKQDLSKDFFIIPDVISSLAFKKCFTASEFVILISGFFTISCLHNFLAFCFNIPFIKTSKG